MSNIFETVKAQVSIPDAARYYGVKIQRGGMICCPFHDDRHPSMKLNEDFFYCFGCGAAGDVTDFVARLFGLTSYEAARKLAEDFGLDPNTPSPAGVRPESLKRRMVKAYRDEEQYCQKVLLEYLHLLEDWKERYAPKNPEEELDYRFVEACQMLDYIEHLADLLLFSDLEVRVTLVGKLYQDSTIQSLEERMERIKENEEEMINEL